MNDADLPSLRAAGRIAAEVMDALAPLVVPSVSTAALDARIRELLAERGAEPALLGYRGFPAAACISVNSVVANGLPSERIVLGPKDIVGINVALSYHGWHSAHNRSFAMDGAPNRVKELAQAAEEACLAACALVRPGASVGELGHAVEAVARRHGFSAPRDFGGHGIGREHHMEPYLPNSGNPGEGETLRAGMVLAIMPMICLGRPETKIKPDGWSVATKDGKAAAEWKHCVLVTAEGGEILTRAG
ncbi:type I methionyl aminopeptidase [Telmatospirillum sp. J64-1]|uniref:type I methionyl aminopeptidase n=1 Tax=Telmatospirillum sp. J64-1 TaxID=2502183 RepID=UPI00115EA721|nr:type I methionyl aminopeptidase [Telmatospirillum sp. J64-1]